MMAIIAFNVAPPSVGKLDWPALVGSVQLTPEVAASVLAAVIALWIAAFAWRRGETSGVPALVAFNLGVAIWTGANAGQVAATTTGGKLAWVNVQYVGIAIVPVALFAFAAHFAGRGHLVSQRRLVALAAPMALLVVLSWTNGLHGLVRTSALTTTVDGVVKLERTFGPAFWAGWVYSQVLLIAATVLVFRAVVYTRDLYRRQVAALVAGALVPWGGHILFLSGISPIEPEVFFSISGVAFVYAVTRHHFLDLMPVERGAVMELLAEGVIVIENDRIVDFNPAAEAMIPRLSVGATITDVFDDQPPLLAAYRSGDGDEITVSMPEGERQFDVSVTDLSGRPGRAIVLHDITPLSEREAELEQKNRQLDEFAAVVSHDLRSPLSVASGYVDLERQEDDSERLQRAAEALQRMDAIIEDLLTLARESEVASEPVTLDSVARAADEQIDRDFTLSVPADVIVEADHDLLIRALANLFDNAVEHGNAQEIRIERIDDGFAVVDDGIGFDEDPRAVFEWGHTDSAGGTGIGLAIVRRVAQSHGWEVNAMDADTGGARFEFRGVSFVNEKSPPETS